MNKDSPALPPEDSSEVILPRPERLKAKKIMRWLVIAAFASYGIYVLVDGLQYVLSHKDGFWFVPLHLGYSGLIFAVAYFVCRRQYWYLCTLFSTVVAILVFCSLVSLPKQLGLFDLFRSMDDSSPWNIFIGLPLSLAALLIPFYGARWAYRFGQSRLSRFIQTDRPPQRAV